MKVRCEIEILAGGGACEFFASHAAFFVQAVALPIIYTFPFRLFTCFRPVFSDKKKICSAGEEKDLLRLFRANRIFVRAAYLFRYSKFRICSRIRDSAGKIRVW